MKKFDALRTATELKNNKKIYGVNSVYGALDGAVNAYSGIKSYFDFTHCTESQIASFDAMHEWISTPFGLAITLGSSVFFSVLANRANIHEKSWEGQFWKSLRETSQASRNAFKGFRGAILTAELFADQNLRYLILPTSLGLGGIYVINRLLMLSVKKVQEKKLNDNNALFTAFMEYGTFTQAVCIEGPEKTFVCMNEKNNPVPIKNRYVIHQEANGQEELYYIDYQGHAELVKQPNLKALKEALRKGTQPLSLLELQELLPDGVAQRHLDALKNEKPQSIPRGKQSLYMVIRAYNGLVDGLYLYLGILSLVPLTPQFLIIAAPLSTLYCILCAINRMYEEYQVQQDILISQYKINLALAAKEVELHLIQLNDTAEALDKQLKNLVRVKKTLQNEYKTSILTLVLLGIKHGLPIYGAIVSAVFAIAFVCSLCSTPLPALFVLGIIATGVLIIPGFILHHAYELLTRKKTEPSLEKDQADVESLRKMITEAKASFRLTHQNAQEARETELIRSRAKKMLTDWSTLGLQTDPLLDRYYPEGAEVFRSFCSGLLKGKKEIELLLNPLQQPDEQGHYQDTAFMLFLIIPASILYAIVFALRAFSKGFSREPANHKSLAQDAPKAPNYLDLEKNTAAKLTTFGMFLPPTNLFDFTRADVLKPPPPSLNP